MIHFLTGSSQPDRSFDTVSLGFSGVCPPKLELHIPIVIPLMGRGCGLPNSGQVTRPNAVALGGPSASNIYCLANVTGARTALDRRLGGGGSRLDFCSRDSSWAVGGGGRTGEFRDSHPVGGEGAGSLTQSAPVQETR